MLSKLMIPLALVVGLLGGAGAGYLLHPAPENTELSDDPAPPPEVIAEPELHPLQGQFMIPILTGPSSGAVMVMNMALEVSPQARASVTRNEPRLRDAFLQVLFDHANAGGFDGNFTAGPTLVSLRRALLENARQVLGSDAVTAVLITDMLRSNGG